MLDFPLIDAHVHFWDPNVLNYPWLLTRDELNRPMLPGDYRQACGEVAVEKIVCMQAECDPLYYARETQWLAQVAQTLEPRIGAIVSYLPLEQGTRLRDDLEVIVDRYPLVKGIRRSLQFEISREFCLQPRFMQAVQMLGEFGLSFDLSLDHTQLESAVELVRQCPDTQFILDHIARPDIQMGELDPWRQDMTHMAQLPNVVCKISGLVTQEDLKDWSAEHFLPYIRHVIHCFGFERLLFGSDWPILTTACDFTRWVRLLEAMFANQEPVSLRNFFHDNAARIYRL